VKNFFKKNIKSQKKEGFIYSTIKIVELIFFQ